MDVEFQDSELKEMWEDPKNYTGRWRFLLNQYRKRINSIKSANDRRDLYAVRGNKFEKLYGDREGQHSLSINDQYRLIVVLIERGQIGELVSIIEIVDYH